MHSRGYSLVLLVAVMFFLGADTSSGQLLGGFSEVQNPSSDSEALEVLEFVTALTATAMSQGDDCGQLELDVVKKVETQVVAGTNYRVSFTMKSNCGIIKCLELRIFKPLPFACPNEGNAAADNPRCLVISQSLTNKCSSVQ